MAKTAERTLTALVSPFGRGERADLPVLIHAGRADRLASPGQRLWVIRDELVIGRGAPAGHLLLDDALASSSHARIVRGAAGHELHDDGSKNGTFLDGARVTGQVRLPDGGRIFVGNHLFVFRLISAADREALDEEQARPLGPVASSAPPLARICQKLRRLATTGDELFLSGETGTGKEVYARAVHAASGRAGRFVAINCAALPRDLVESELFGYRQGAHSTAQGAKAGLLEEAHGGTLFLDEIGEMNAEAQTKLLRFLQDKEVTPLGSTQARRLDVRVIAATNRPVAPGGNSGVRDDLLARLGAAPLTLPPLREHLEDLGPLIAHFARARGVVETLVFEVPAFRALSLHRWPLNVRELEKLLATAIALVEGRRPVAQRDLPDGLLTPDDRAPVVKGGRKPPERAPSAAELETLLAQHAGQVADVSRALGRQRAAVWRWIKQLGIDPAKYRRKPR